MVVVVVVPFVVTLAEGRFNMKGRFFKVLLVLLASLAWFSAKSVGANQEKIANLTKDLKRKRILP